MMALVNTSVQPQFEGSVEIKGKIDSDFQGILTPEALRFLVKLHRNFNSRRGALLERRVEVQEKIDRGMTPDFLSETHEIRRSNWAIASIPPDLTDRRVEITGPVDRKMIINALNSGAQVYMADFEDSHSPTWKGTLEGQVNLYDAIRKTIRYRSPEGKDYSLAEKTATLVVRPRGWHLSEKHVVIGGEMMSASLFDFGLFFFHNARELISRGTGPYFYLPKMESHLEARLWNDVFVFAQKELEIPQGTIRATVLIETILAAFEMDEILYELRQHSAGLNCGRWDYIFSFIKKFKKHPNFILPDRAKITMDVHFLKSYCQQLIKTCHHRRIHAMGGMAAQIPIKSDPVANQAAMNKVIADKQREVSLGHDGTWVAHPGLVTMVREVFDAGMPGSHQIELQRNEWKISASDLLQVPGGDISEAGLRLNINVAILYLESWLRGSGCVPLYNLMEDAATAEISRAQVWQWLYHGRVKPEDYQRIYLEEMKTIQSLVGVERFEAGQYQTAGKLFTEMVRSTEFVEFLTLPAYDYL